MPAEAVALAEPVTIKISSKRQITIPAKWHKEMGFSEYALATWTDQGLLIQPIEVKNEDVSVSLLRYLVKQGFEGDELVAEYEKQKNKIVEFDKLVEEGIRDVEEGRTAPFSETREKIRTKYGL